MRLRNGSSFAGLAFVVALLLATIGAPDGRASRHGHAQSRSANASGPPTDTSTPAPTRTPAPTPTATATLTELQNRLLLADTYLKAGQSAKAVELYLGDPGAGARPAGSASWPEEGVGGPDRPHGHSRGAVSHGRASHTCAALGSGL